MKSNELFPSSNEQTDSYSSKSNMDAFNNARSLVEIKNTPPSKDELRKLINALKKEGGSDIKTVVNNQIYQVLIDSLIESNPSSHPENEIIDEVFNLLAQTLDINPRTLSDEILKSYSDKKEATMTYCIEKFSSDLNLSTNVGNEGKSKLISKVFTTYYPSTGGIIFQALPMWHRKSELGIGKDLKLISGYLDDYLAVIHNRYFVCGTTHGMYNKKAINCEVGGTTKKMQDLTKIFYTPFNEKEFEQIAISSSLYDLRQDKSEGVDLKIKLQLPMTKKPTHYIKRGQQEVYEGPLSEYQPIQERLTILNSKSNSKDRKLMETLRQISQDEKNKKAIDDLEKAIQNIGKITLVNLKHGLDKQVEGYAKEKDLKAGEPKALYYQIHIDDDNMREKIINLAWNGEGAKFMAAADGNGDLIFHIALAEDMLTLFQDFQPEESKFMGADIQMLDNE
jgi:hypothetical protein